jgi:hypothetical protein
MNGCGTGNSIHATGTPKDFRTFFFGAENPSPMPGYREHGCGTGDSIHATGTPKDFRTFFFGAENPSPMPGYREHGCGTGIGGNKFDIEK